MEDKFNWIKAEIKGLGGGMNPWLFIKLQRQHYMVHCRLKHLRGCGFEFM